MTELLYLSDPYIQRFEATIVDHIGGAVVLDKTAFYPGGGGQPSDQGQLFADEGLWQVIKVKRIGGEIGHYLDGESPSVGTQVVGQLDWPRRYNLMRIHTALHILCGVIWRDYKSSVTGGNMEPLNGRMDFEFETMRQELVLVRTLPREEAFQIPDLIRTKINLLPEGIKEVRTVEIVGLDLQADGGTHVANTREVGNIRVVDYKSKGKINKRIYIELDA
jgi:misacylated tRNA(Ala) deacylase